MREEQDNKIPAAQPSDSEHHHYQDDRDTIARLLAKLLTKMWLKRRSTSTSISETL